MLYVATQPHQMTELRETARLLNDHHETAILLDAGQARAAVNSPTYQGGCLRRTGKATVHPVRLAWGLRRVAESLGTRIYEHTPVRRLAAEGAGVTARHPLRGGAGGPGRRRDQRLPVAGAGHPPVRGPGIRLRAGH